MNIKQVKVMKREENQLQIINGKEQRTETDPPPPFLQLLIENRKPKCRVRRPSANTTTLFSRFSKQNIDWVEQTYADDVALYKKHCPDGFRSYQ